MKKIIALTLLVLVTLSAFCLTAFADEGTAQVYVTISDEAGKTVLAQEPVTVTDIDGDNALTVNDALYAAHEANYKGGAQAGYASSQSDYGMSLDMLWGVANGGSYGYYVNNASAWSLTDPVKSGDYVNAFVYTDLAYWSDTYCFFDVNTVSAKQNDEVTLTLSASGYDADWNPITVAVEGATITVNGTATQFTTDAQGKVTVKLTEAGKCVISAVSDSVTLVPPVCVASVEAIATEPVVTAPEDTQASETLPPTEAEKSPATGDNTYIAVTASVLMLVLAGAVVCVKKKVNEK